MFQRHALNGTCKKKQMSGQNKTKEEREKTKNNLNYPLTQKEKKRKFLEQKYKS